MSQCGRCGGGASERASKRMTVSDCLLASLPASLPMVGPSIGCSSVLKTAAHIVSLARCGSHRIGSRVEQAASQPASQSSFLPCLPTAARCGAAAERGAAERNLRVTMDNYGPLMPRRTANTRPTVCSRSNGNNHMRPMKNLTVKHVLLPARRDAATRRFVQDLSATHFQLN